MEEEPFPDLKISSTDFLDTLGGRSKCSKCEKSRKYYCYNCYLAVPEIEAKVPRVKLPIKVDIIKHPSEVDGKSTAVHAAVIAPDDVSVYTYPCIPDYDDKSKVVLVFPGETSITLADMARKLGIKVRTDRCKQKRKADDESKADDEGDKVPVKVAKVENEEKSLDEGNRLFADGSSDSKFKPGSGDSNNGTEQKKTESSDKSSKYECHIKEDKSGLVYTFENNTSADLEQNSTENGCRLVPKCSLERVVFIDSTWNQTKTICSDERLAGLQCIELKTQETKFWRHQKDIPNTYLSTVEAIYYFLREYHEQFMQTEYNGEYDNLLFFFTYMYKKIRTLYDGGSELKAYKKISGK